MHNRIADYILKINKILLIIILLGFINNSLLCQTIVQGAYYVYDSRIVFKMDLSGSTRISANIIGGSTIIPIGYSGIVNTKSIYFQNIIKDGDGRTNTYKCPFSYSDPPNYYNTDFGCLDRARCRIDDPVILSSDSSFYYYKNNFNIKYGPYFNNGNTPYLQYCIGANGAWTNYSGSLSYSSSGGTISVNVRNLFTYPNRYVQFRIVKKLIDSDNTLSYGNILSLYFYDPTIFSVPTPIACENDSISLLGRSQDFPTLDPDDLLEVKLAIAPFNVWYRLNWQTVRLRYPSTKLSYSDIYNALGTDCSGKEVLIRSIQTTGNGGVIIRKSAIKSIVFLPIPNVTVTSQAPTCYAGQDATITLKFNDVPPTGCVDPTNASVPIILTVYQYGLEALSNDVTYTDTIISGTHYYYHNGATMIKEPNLSGTNTVTYNWQDFNSNFKFERGMYRVKATINSGTAQCPSTSGFQYLDAPIPFTASAIAEKILGYPAYNVKTGDNQGTVKFKFHGGTAPYEIRKDNISGSIIKSLSISDLTADSTFTLTVSTDHVETTTRTYYIKDRYNCQGSGPVTVYFIRPPDITIARSDSSTTSCNTNDTGDHGNGMISWVVTGGYDAFQSSIALYRLPDKTNEILATKTRKSGGIIEFTGSSITKGYYGIRVTDKMNPLYSVWSDPILVDEPNALNINLTPHNPTCDYKNDGWIDISTTGGNGGYSYTVMKGSFPVSDYSQGLSDGTYTITLQDSKYCIQSTSQTLSDPPALTLDARYLQPASCSTIRNGQAKAVVTNFRNTDSYVTFKIGATDLTKSYDGSNIFSLSNLQNNENALITVTDAYSNCQASDTIRIPLRSPQFSTTSATTTFAPCTGKNGIVKLTMNHPEGSNFSYTLDGVAGSTFSGAFKTIPLKGHSYHTITVIDVASGCSYTLTDVTIDVRLDSLKLKRPVEKVSTWCASVNTGQLKVEKQFGWGNIKFQISPDSIKHNTNSATFYKLFTGWHTIVATDDSLCMDTVNVNIPINPNTLSLSFYNPVKAACKGESYTGELKVSRYVNGKKTGYGALRLNPTATSDTTYSHLKSGLYTITALDDYNCPASITDSVKFDSNPVSFTIDSLYDQRCKEVKNAKLYLKAHTSRGTNQTFRFSLKGDTTVWHAPTIAYNVDTAGTFIFGVIDPNNCGTNLTHTIQNLHYAPKPRLDSSYQVACKNATNGYLSIYNTPNNSVPKYKYQLGAKTLYAATSAQKVTFPGLTKGYHIITATDTLGCQDTARFVVNVRSDSVRISRIDTTSAACIVAQNGKAKIVASSFDKSNTENKYTFLCNGNTLQGDSVTFSMLPVMKTGMYPVTVTDQFGCQDTKTFAISVRKDTLNLWQRTTVNAACPDSSSGFINVRRINGASTYRFQVTSTPAGISRTFYSNDTLVPITKLPQGNYRIVVKDTNNCSAFINNILIIQPQNINFSSFSQNYIKHKGQPEGQMNASVQLGNRKYNYEWLNLADNSLISSGKTVEFTNIQLNNRLAGNYLLRVRDTANCFVGTTGWLEKQFKIVEPAQDLALTVKTMRRVSCFGLHDGEFELKASGGWGHQYQYGFDALNLYADSVFSGRSIGTVTMFAKDTSGVTTSLDVTITQPQLLKANLASKDDANCFGSADGNATLDISGGNEPKYFVSTDNTQWTPGNSLSSLLKGDYTIYVRDSLHCTTTVPVSINQPPQIVRDSYHITDTRCGFGNGVITSKISGGVPGYTYQWYKGSNKLSFTTDSAYNLFSGSYQLSVTDLHNCTSGFPFNVSDITDLTIDTIYTQPVTCWGYSDGKASTLLSKGNPPYKITWPDSTHLTSVTGLKTGNYSLWVTDQEKCNVYRDFIIGTPLNIYLSTKTITDPLCEGVNDGALDMEASGSFNGFNYLWNTGSTKNSIKNLTPGNYTLTVTDDHSCSNQFNFTLKYQQAITPKLGADLTLCKGNAFRLNPGIFSDYKWTSTIGFTSRLPEVSIDQPANYFVEVTDNVGCVGRDTIKIDQSTTDLQGKLLIATNVEQNDTVVIFEASWPIPDSVKFKLNGCKVLTSGAYYREVIFADTGTYTIGLTSYLNDCLDMVSKDIKVEPKSESQLKSVSAKLIQSYHVSPNPSSGQFLTEITLREDATIYLKLANLATGVITDVREYKGSNTYNISYSLNNLAPGTYILHLQAGNEAKTKTIIIM